MSEVQGSTAAGSASQASLPSTSGTGGSYSDAVGPLQDNGAAGATSASWPSSPAWSEAGMTAVRSSFQNESPAETSVRQPPPLFRDPLPESGGEARVSRYREPGGREVILLDAGHGDDDIEVIRDRQAGGVVVTVNGEAYHFTAGQARSLTIEAGRGDDTIRVADDLWTGLTLRGNTGDDVILVGTQGPRIHNIYGGPGRDLIREPATAAVLQSLRPDQRAYFEHIQALEPPVSTAVGLDAARGSRPLTAAERQQVLDAQRTIEELDLERIVDLHDPNQILLHVSFDGTWFDREEMPVDTNPALLEDVLADRELDRSLYYPGVGTEPRMKLLGAVTGAGAKARIASAYRDVVESVEQIREKKPGAEVVLVLSGFSRGAATAREFANLLNERGVPMGKELGESKLEPPRIGAMVLFDTVASFGVPGNNINLGYDLAIAPNIENVLHLTADDEARNFFPLTSAVDPARPHDPRITEIGLPGSHTDIGGSYPNEYSRLVLGMAYRYLEKLGVALEPSGHLSSPNVSDPSLRLHDPGGGANRPVYPVTNPRPIP